MKLRLREISGFPIVPLEEVAEILDYRRKPVSSTLRAAMKGDIPYYGANGLLDHINQHLFEEELVLVAEDGGFFDDPHKPIAYRVGGKSWVNNHAHVLRPRSAIDIDWLNFAIAHQDVAEFVNGAVLPKLTQRDLKRLPIPLPKPAEQRRVVGRIKECLSRVEEMQRLREEALMDATSLLDALINEFLSEAAGPTARLGDVVSIASALVDPRLSQYRDLLHIGGANIVSGTGELLNLKTAADEKLISSKFLFTPQDVIYSKIRPKLRKVVRPDFRGLCSADSYPLRPIDDRTHRDFLFYLLLSRKLTDYAIGGSNRAGIPKVNREHLMAFEFTLPKPKVQERIAAKLNESWKAARQIAKELADAEEYPVLRESILREAFTGNL